MIIFHFIDTFAPINARIARTFIDVYLTMYAFITGIGTVAGVTVQAVDAMCSI